jgi:hypothetical protein
MPGGAAPCGPDGEGYGADAGDEDENGAATGKPGGPGCGGIPGAATWCGVTVRGSVGAAS